MENHSRIAIQQYTGIHILIDTQDSRVSFRLLINDATITCISQCCTIDYGLYSRAASRQIIVVLTLGQVFITLTGQNLNLINSSFGRRVVVISENFGDICRCTSLTASGHRDIGNNLIITRRTENVTPRR